MVYNPLPKAKIELTAQKSQYLLGEQVKGEIKIFSDEDLQAAQTVVFLSCNEDIKKSRIFGIKLGLTEYWDKAVIYNASSVLMKLPRIPKGFKETYPYALTISTAAKETIYSIDHYIRWFLYAILEVKDHPSLQTLTYEVQVGRPQNMQSSPTVVKEVHTKEVREIVLIPCAYYGSLIPQTAIFCPHCGARRKS